MLLSAALAQGLRLVCLSFPGQENDENLDREEDDEHEAELKGSIGE